MTDVEQIAAYLAEDLPPSGRSAFEERLRAEPAFADAFAAQQDAMLLFKAAQRAEAKQQLKKQLKQVPETSSEKRIIPMWAWSAMAIAAVCLALVWLVPQFISTGFPSPTPQEFALSQLEAYPLLTSRGENTPLAEQKEKAFSFYQNGQYSEALAVFESMFSSPDAGQTSDDIRMYYADCLSLTGKYPEAADQYQRLRDSDYYDAAEWRLVMVLILNNESAEARYILESITKNSLHYKHAEAVALLKKME